VVTIVAWPGRGGFGGIRAVSSTTKQPHLLITYPNDNQVSAALTDANVTDILAAIATIEAALPFVISRPPGDNNVMLGEKSVGFDEKCATYMTSSPQFRGGRDIALRCSRPQQSEGRNECGKMCGLTVRGTSPDAALGDADGAARHPYLGLAKA
jgi:hypothetical protein